MDKSTASAQGYQSWLGKAVTALVVELGYDYCEYALVRVARGQRAVVAAKGFPDVSGEMLDAIVMEGLILALRKRRMFLGLKQWSGSEWLLYRKVAEELRKTLVRYAESMILLPSKLTRLDRELKVRLSRDAFARRVAALLSCVVESIQGALEQNGLEVKDVDALLLTGGVARTVPVREIFLQALGGKPHVTDPHLSAVGAACQAARTGDGAVHWDGPPLAVDVSSELSASDASAWWPPPRKPEDEEFIEVVDEDTAGPTNAALLVEKPSLERVRELIGEGKYRLAATVLDAVADEVEELRQQLAHGDRPSPQQYLEQARRRLEARQCEEAVALAHKAFEAAPEDPAVFDAMMQVHADAGLRLDRPEEFSAAVAILTCAHRHDQTNRTIHRAMCERHYRHAVAMLSSKEPAEALAALQAGLAYDPKHAGASQLLQELSRPSA